MSTGDKLQDSIDEMRDAFSGDLPFWSSKYVIDGVWLHSWVARINPYMLEEMKLLPRDLGKRAIYVSLSVGSRDDTERSQWLLVVEGPLAMDLIDKRVRDAFSEFVSDISSESIRIDE